MQSCLLHQHFNSIKVRLEPTPPPYHQDMMEFQFHKGAIRTVVAIAVSARGVTISIP